MRKNVFTLIPLMFKMCMLTRQKVQYLEVSFIILFFKK